MYHYTVKLKTCNRGNTEKTHTANCAVWVLTKTSANKHTEDDAEWNDDAPASDAM